MQSESPLLSKDGCGLGGLQHFPSSHPPVPSWDRCRAAMEQKWILWVTAGPSVGLGSRWTGQPPLGLPWIKPRPGLHFPRAPCRRNLYWSHFTDGETETHRKDASCPGLSSNLHPAQSQEAPDLQGREPLLKAWLCVCLGYSLPQHSLHLT